jgi:molybdopterin molybdotransferase
LASELTGRYADWTQFIFGILEIDGDIPVFRANKEISRLRSMAQAQAVVAIPEGKTVLPAGKIVAAQLLEEQGL